MSDRTQTLSVELDGLDRLADDLGGNPKTALLASVGRLRSLLSQPEQGETPSLVLSDEDRERLERIADELDPPVRMPGPVPFASEMRAAKFLRNLASQEHWGEEQDYLERYERACERADNALDLAEGYRVVLERVATETKITDINGEYEKTGPLDAAECRALAAEAIANPQRVQPPTGEAARLREGARRGSKGKGGS